MEPLYLVTFESKNIHMDSVTYCLGVFETEEIAQMAINEAVKQHPDLKDRFLVQQVIKNFTYKVGEFNVNGKDCYYSDLVLEDIF